MKIYNTLSKKIEEFIPNNSEYVSMYTCGSTVYNYVHIGNLRTYIFENNIENIIIVSSIFNRHARNFFLIFIFKCYMFT